MKIVIGVDDSPHSRAAVEWVRGMAWPAGSSMVVVSVVKPAVPVYADVYVPAPTHIQQMSDDMMRFHQEIASAAERELRNTGLATEARVLIGDPRTELVETARAVGAGLVVVGSHGRTGLARLLMGSVASHVVAHAPCSVMVVKLPKTGKAA
ncbi:MAG TPA: universal stress protein [Candidatus Eisenbacteria bacterium]|nr:universal stress protein [Candidatus Eisenbacteria bacterium]